MNSIRTTTVSIFAKKSPIHLNNQLHTTAIDIDIDIALMSSAYVVVKIGMWSIYTHTHTPTKHTHPHIGFFSANIRTCVDVEYAFNCNEEPTHGFQVCHIGHRSFRTLLNPSL